MTTPTTALTPTGTAPTPAPTPAEPWTNNTTDLEHFGADHPRPKETYSPEVGSRLVMRQHQPMLRDVLGYRQVQVQAHHRGHVAMLREADLNAETVGAKLYGTHMQALVANARGTELDENRQQQVEEEIRRELRERYGAPRAEVLLQATQEFVRAHPRLRRVIETPGFAVQPSVKDTLDELIEHVRKVKNI